MSDVAELPETLWHYTSAVGLKGILERQEIWATDARFLNDRTEHALFREAMYARIEQRYPGITRFDAENRYREFPNRRLIEAVHGLTNRSSRVPYIASLSAHGDMLSQWRAYSPAQGGYAIGLSRAVLNQIATALWESSGRECRLVRCTYSTAEQLRASSVFDQVDTYLSEFDHLVALWRDNKLGAGQMTAWVVAANPIGYGMEQMAAPYKHTAFSEEAEWRLMVLRESSSIATADGHRQPPLTRVRGSVLIPYLPVRLVTVQGASAITHIRIGPSIEPSLADAGVREFLRSGGLDEVRVDHSDIPYRVAF